MFTWSSWNIWFDERRRAVAGCIIFHMSKRLIIGVLAGIILFAAFFYAISISFRRLPPDSVRPSSRPVLHQPAKSTQESTHLSAAVKQPTITGSSEDQLVPVDNESPAPTERPAARLNAPSVVLGNNQGSLTSDLQKALTNISSVLN